MDMKVFVAGATGVVGRRLVPMLVQAGHEVVGTTRSAAKLDALRALGAQGVVLDGLDGAAVGQAVAQAEPEVVIHQMTALSESIDFKHFDTSFARTNELRTAGVDHLLAASEAAGVRRVVAQGYAAWRVPDGVAVPEKLRGVIAAMQHLERVVPASSVEGVVLRYGGFYGPDASQEIIDAVRRRQMPLVGDGAGVWSFLHVDDAAAAALAAIDHGAPGTYDVVDDEPAPVSVWLPYLADVLGAKPPRHVPVWAAKMLAGDVVATIMTKVQGSSNARAKRELGWTPVWPTWREGFVRGLGLGPRAAADVHASDRG
jgi:nucleoside-diphosphate-sugar epimerase